MTTIIVIVVVALVFFVTVCVATLMIWKRETEMRTDSLKAIEQNLQEMLNEMNDGRRSDLWTGIREKDVPVSVEEIVDISPAVSRGGRRRSADPFAWVKMQATSDKKLKTETEDTFEAKSAKKTDLEQMEEIILPEVSSFENDIPESDLSENDSSAHLTLDESFREIENLIKGLTEEVIEYERALEMEKDNMQAGDTGDESEKEKAADEIEDSPPDVESSEEFTEIMEIFDEENTVEPVRKPMGYDTGKSGRKYTAEELEMLIKE